MIEQIRGVIFWLSEWWIWIMVVLLLAIAGIGYIFGIWVDFYG